MSEMSFGGDWSCVKLKIVEDYLRAYTTIMTKRSFRFVYIDAFAGTGYQTFEREDNPNELMFPELAEEETRYLDGSARISLKVEPGFETYVFLEKDEKRFAELEKIQSEYSNKDIRLRNVDANDYLYSICSQYDWKKYRAVVFLDPFGMQVKWTTIEAIASTRAIDLWYLFPLGIGVNRLLKKDGQISPTWQQKLDEIFGEKDWVGAFYQTLIERTLFGEEIRTKKVGDFTSITQYFVQRLNAVFPQVAHNPLQLHNTRNNPMYLLCFASTNATAKKIAEGILKKY